MKLYQNGGEGGIFEIGRIPAERNTTYSRMKIKVPATGITSECVLVPEFA